MNMQSLVVVSCLVVSGEDFLPLTLHLLGYVRYVTLTYTFGGPDRFHHPDGLGDIIPRTR